MLNDKGGGEWDSMLEEEGSDSVSIVVHDKSFISMLGIRSSQG